MGAGLFDDKSQRVVTFPVPENGNLETTACQRPVFSSLSQQYKLFCFTDDREEELARVCCITMMAFDLTRLYHTSA